MNSLEASTLKLPIDPLALPAFSSPLLGRRERWLAVVLFALAMAWVESAVVFYIRSLVNRILPYQPQPLPVSADLAFAEIIREAATLVMLATIGWLAGTTWRSRIGFALLAFGVWDIAYYIWLVPMTGWPTSLADWDVLFLIPLPWWGPVWAPTSIAALMIAYGTVITAHDSPQRPLVPSRISAMAAATGVVIALYVFMADSLRVVLAGGGVAQLRAMLPHSFNWPLFTFALFCLAMPVASVIRRAGAVASEALSGLDCQKWVEHFTRNRRNRPEPQWTAPMVLPADLLAALVPSLEQFQLGDGGGECRLIAYNAQRFTGSSAQIQRLVDLWFAEEAEHSRLLGCAVDRFGGRPIRSHWSFTAFCQVRRLLGVTFELQVLTLTELVSTAYYRVLRRHGRDNALRQMCALIMRDEAGHVAFHRDRLAADGRHDRGVRQWLWALQFWLCGYAAASVLWSSHGHCLCTLGATRREYFREVRREIARFITLTRRISNSTRPSPAPPPPHSPSAANSNSVERNSPGHTCI